MHRTLLLLAAFLTAFAAASAKAEAQPGHPLPGTEPGTEYRHRWYGWQIWIADAAMTSVFAFSEREELLYGLAFSGAAVHLLHQNPLRAAASVGVRVALTLPGFLVDRAENCSASDEECGGAGAYLFVAGGFIAIAIDSLLFTFDRVEVARQPFVPTVSNQGGGLQFGVAASF